MRPAGRAQIRTTSGHRSTSRLSAPPVPTEIERRPYQRRDERNAERQEPGSFATQRPHCRENSESNAERCGGDPHLRLQLRAPESMEVARPASRATLRHDSIMAEFQVRRRDHHRTDVLGSCAGELPPIPPAYPRGHRHQGAGPCRPGQGVPDCHPRPSPRRSPISRPSRMVARRRQCHRYAAVRCSHTGRSSAPGRTGWPGALPSPQSALDLERTELTGS